MLLGNVHIQVLSGFLKGKTRPYLRGTRDSLPREELLSSLGDWLLDLVCNDSTNRHLEKKDNEYEVKLEGQQTLLKERIEKLKELKRNNNQVEIALRIEIRYRDYNKHNLHRDFDELGFIHIPWEFMSSPSGVFDDTEKAPILDLFYVFICRSSIDLLSDGNKNLLKKKLISLRKPLPRNEKLKALILDVSPDRKVSKLLSPKDYKDITLHVLDNGKESNELASYDNFEKIMLDFTPNLIYYTGGHSSNDGDQLRFKYFKSGDKNNETHYQNFGRNVKEIIKDKTECIILQNHEMVNSNIDPLEELAFHFSRKFPLPYVIYFPPLYNSDYGNQTTNVEENPKGLISTFLGSLKQKNNIEKNSKSLISTFFGKLISEYGEKQYEKALHNLRFELCERVFKADDPLYEIPIIYCNTVEDKYDPNRGGINTKPDRKNLDIKKPADEIAKHSPKEKDEIMAFFGDLFKTILEINYKKNISDGDREKLRVEKAAEIIKYWHNNSHKLEKYELTEIFIDNWNKVGLNNYNERFDALLLNENVKIPEKFKTNSHGA